MNPILEKKNWYPMTLTHFYLMDYPLHIDTISMELSILYFKGLFVCLILYIPLTIFQLNRVGSSWVEPVLS